MKSDACGQVGVGNSDGLGGLWLMPSLQRRKIMPGRGQCLAMMAGVVAGAGRQPEGLVAAGGDGLADGIGDAGHRRATAGFS